MKKRVVIALLACLSVTIPAVPARAYTHEELIIKDNLPYDYLSEFSEGFSRVGKDMNGDGIVDKWGLIDSQGNEVVPPKYDYMSDVSDGMVKVGQDLDDNSMTGNNSGGGGMGIDKYGFINTKGNEVVPLIYDSVEDFSEGLAAVSTNYQYVDDSLWNGAVVNAAKYGFVNKTGEVVIPLIYDGISGIQISLGGLYGTKYGFSQGAASVCKDGKWGAIDQQGNVIVPFTYDGLSGFCDGLAKASKNDKSGFVDKQGEVVIPITYDMADDFSEGYTTVGKNDSNSKNYVQWGVIDRRGKLVVPMIYNAIYSFSEGMARVANTSDGTFYKYGFIDTTGKLVVPMIYNSAGDFSGGMASVGINDERFSVSFKNKYGFIDKAGKIVIPISYDSVRDFSDGLALAGRNISDLNVQFSEPPEYGYIDTNGNTVIPMIYGYDTTSFSDGVAVVRKQNNTFSIIENPLFTETKSAIPTASKVVVNSVDTAFDAYTIDQNNYFKLRDLAKVLSGTEKQFEVTWDSDKNAINLMSSKAYTPVGGEMEKGDSASITAQANTSAIYLNGEPVTLKAYTINGNNYFKLRDIGKTFDFDVSWDGTHNTIVIDTSKGYTED